MKFITMKSCQLALSSTVFACVLGFAATAIAAPFAPSTQPPESTAVPGNVLLALSVEYPTGLQASYTAAYAFATKYDGYFDNRKCYSYDTTAEVFSPISQLNAVNGTCPVSTQWSGNLLNWLTMTNVDQFRSVMTGGTRDIFSSMAATNPGDTPAQTILIRSLSDRNNYNPNKTITALVGMPLAGTQIVRQGGYGSKFIVANVASASNMTAAEQRLSCAATPAAYKAPTLAGGACYNIRVKACVNVPTTVGMEPNCNSTYSIVPGQVAKPEGLIQSYSNSLRFGAFGFLNESGQTRNGGVLRAAMKSVGPYAATSSTVIPNPAKEWNEATGVMVANPDTTDAADSGVADSGLMNYLNKFGFAAGYKVNDPVSELYYAAQLYLRGVLPPGNYSGLPAPTAAGKDGFPVITGGLLDSSNTLLQGKSRDPIINSCQKNFILGIGDIYTHCDGNLPGSTKTGAAATCPNAVAFTDPNGLNVQNLWETTRALEGLADTGWVGGATNGTPYMAGLAHWANTNDIRPTMTGTQNISTYWVDVLEANNGAATSALGSLRKSQFWLAAKYGGFRTDLVPPGPASNDPNSVQNSWDAPDPVTGLSDGIPDTWFAGNNPTALKAGLSKAFADIAVRAGASSASSAAVTSNRQTSNSQILYAGYNPKGWTGTVRACSPSQTSTSCDTAPAWEASKWFKATAPTGVTTPLLPTTRKIFTSYGGGASLTSMPFTYASLNPAQQTILNAADSQGPARVAYLRGDRSLENALFRKREDTLLGDIVNSGVTYVSGAGPAYAGNREAAYLAFRDCNKNGCAARPAPRRPVVYVGANDGMLHAFSAANGKELFAYIPGSVFNNLPALTSLGFQHQYYVDSTPMVADIQQDTTTWKTVLVGGLGAGGRGYYALNITDQNAFASSWSTSPSGDAATPENESSAQAALKEIGLANLPMWEFTSTQDVDMGYTFNEPSLNPLTGAYLQIAKVADNTISTGVWRVIVGNGYGSAAGTASLFMLDANTGIDPTTGLAPHKLEANPGPGNGLSTPTPVDTNNDGMIDTIYAGDMLGNMHKFQFSKPNPTGSDFILAAPGPAGGGVWRHLGKVLSVGQPISTAPTVARSCDGTNWSVAFGTGKLNENSDYSDISDRGFYSVVDKNPSTSLTVAGADLVDIVYTPPPSETRTWATPNLTGKSGWKMKFENGERILSNSTRPPDTGVVLFGTTKPAGDVCTPGNTGFIMAVNMCTGKIGDIISGSLVVGGIGIKSTGVVKVSNSYTDSGNKQAIVCNQAGCKPPDTCTDPAGCTLKLKGVIAPKGRYSWRQIFTK